MDGLSKRKWMVMAQEILSRRHRYGAVGLGQWHKKQQSTQLVDWIRMPRRGAFNGLLVIGECGCWPQRDRVRYNNESSWPSRHRTRYNDYGSWPSRNRTR